MPSYFEPGSWGTNTINSDVLYDDAGRATYSSGDVETAAQRHGGNFPASWGDPVGSPYSEERAAWVRSKVETHQVEQWLRGGDARVALAMVRAMATDD